MQNSKVNTGLKNISLLKRITPILILAFLTSLYLLHHDLEIASGYKIGTSICSFNELFDCDELSRSAYSKFLGLPVAMYGSIFYGMLLLITFFYRRSEDSKAYDSIILFFSLLSIFPSLYLGYASYFIVGKVCIFCSFLYVLNFFLFFLSYYFGKQNASFFKRISSGFLSYLKVLFFGRGLAFPVSFFGLIIFIFFGQLEYIRLVLEPRFYAVYDVKVLDELYTIWKNEIYHEDFEGIDKLPDGVVVIGNKDAPYTLVEFSDYECPMCHRMGPIVTEIFEEYKDKLKVVFLSFPLDSSCNPLISTELHPLACNLSKLVICEALTDNERAYNLHKSIIHAQISSKSDYNRFIQDEALDEDTCLFRDEVKISLEQQINLGIKSRIQGTPSFFFNGKRIIYDSMGQLKPLLELIMSNKEK